MIRTRTHPCTGGGRIGGAPSPSLVAARARWRGLRRVDDVDAARQRRADRGRLGRAVERRPSAAATDAGYTGPEADDHVLDLGRPAGDQEPAGDRRRVPRRQPEDHGQGRPCPTGSPTGTSSRPASPAATRPTSSRWTARSSPTTRRRDVLLDLKPYIDRDGYDLGQLADQAVADFTTPDGQFGLPRDLNVIALFYNKKMFDAAGHPLPRRHVGLGEAGRGRQAAHGQGRQRQGQPVGLLHRDHRHGELLVVARLAERRRHHLGRPQDEPRRQRPGRRRASSSCRTSSGRTRSCRTRPSGRPTAATRSSRARRPWRPTARGSSRPTSPPGIDFGIAPLPKGPAGRATSINPTGAVVYKGTQEPGCRLGVREVPRQPGGADQDHGAEGVAAGQQGGPGRPVRDARSTAPRSSPTRSPTPTSSRRSRATTSGRPTLQTEIDANVFTDPKKTAKQAIDRRAAAARRDPRRPVTGRDRRPGAAAA